jgi:prevent-host-death family protein
MPQVAVDTLRDHLREYVKRASHGERIVVTVEDRPVAVLTAAEESREIRQGWELVRGGVARWSGGKPHPPTNPPRIKGRPTSEIVLEDRR